MTTPDLAALRERMRTTIGDVHVTPAELSALISSHESLAARLAESEAAAARMRELLRILISQAGRYELHWFIHRFTGKSLDEIAAELWDDSLELTKVKALEAFDKHSTAGRELLAELERLREENSRWIKQNAQLARNQHTDWEAIAAQNSRLLEAVRLAKGAMEGVVKFWDESSAFVKERFDVDLADDTEAQKNVRAALEAIAEVGV